MRVGEEGEVGSERVCLESISMLAVLYFAVYTLLHLLFFTLLRFYFPFLCYLICFPPVENLANQVNTTFSHIHKAQALVVSSISLRGTCVPSMFGPSTFLCRLLAPQNQL